MGGSGGDLKVKEYFDRIAENYPKMTSSLLLGQMRRREVESVFKMLSPRHGDLILDAGCGAGYYSTPLKALGANVLGIDLSTRMAAMASASGADVMVADLRSFSLKARFDKILCAGVLEFSGDPLTIIKNLRHHLKDDGYMVFLIPKLSPIGVLYKLYHLSHGVRVRLFSLRGFELLLEDAGLRMAAVEEPTWMSLVAKCDKEGLGR
ncbi:MAG: class I SAM-dependent methyltransferase [Candidatus Bathyarchaeia archaeon]